MKILFLIKGNYSYGQNGTAKSGLLDSAKLTAHQLIKYLGIDTSVEICIDANEIDKEVFDFAPDICIIEALWVTPEKMQEISNLHPGVIFFIRIHSEISFLSTEGVAIDWLKKYVLINNVFLAFNSETTANDFTRVVEKCNYLPNLYAYMRINSDDFITQDVNLVRIKKQYVDIASFGALRPMKNQMVQAFSAIEFGNANNKIVHFHINAGRTEQGGEEVLKNLQSLFEGTNHSLIEHGWLSRGDFLELISFMDIGLQISFSESFNIVSADFIRSSIPLIVSDAVRWMPKKSKVKNDVEEISEKINHVLHFSDEYIHDSKKALNEYNTNALNVWKSFLKIK